MSKPMRACKNKNQSPKNKLPVYPHMQSNFSSSWFSYIYKKALFAVGFYYLHCPFWGYAWREKKMKRLTPCSQRVEKLNNGREFWEAASWRTQNLAKTEWTELFFFNARGGWEKQKLIILPLCRLQDWRATAASIFLWSKLPAGSEASEETWVDWHRRWWAVSQETQTCVHRPSGLLPWSSAKGGDIDRDSWKLGLRGFIKGAEIFLGGSQTSGSRWNEKLTYHVLHKNWDKFWAKLSPL